MTFWSDETLERRLPQLIKPYSHTNVGCASYELHVGAESFVTPVYDAKPQDRAKRIQKDGETIVIPQGQFAFLITQETVAVPDDAVAFISIKAKIKFRGLINVSGFHVDPGYSGRLIFSVFNAGGGDVLLECGKPAFLIWYASLDKPSTKPKRSLGHENIPSEIIQGLNNDIFSLPTFDTRLKDVEKKVDRIFFFSGILLTVISLLIAAATFGLRLWERADKDHSGANTALPQLDVQQTASPKRALPTNAESSASSDRMPEHRRSASDTKKELQ